MKFHRIYDIILYIEGKMYILVGIIILASIVIILSGLYSVFKTKINFYITGLDSKFSIPNLNLLWKVAVMCKLENPTSLFFSLPSLQKCMSEITSRASADGNSGDPKMQQLISKLFEYRTKLQNESDEKKGMDSTKGLERGQKLRIILPGKGVFVSEVLNSASQLIISVPRQKDLIPITAEQWVGKVINVYLWKKGDARYVFDTTVEGHGLFIGESSLSLKHSTNLVRTQKRKAVRAKCKINAQLFIIKGEVIDYNAVETHDGYKCLLEDISESGALIRIGGKGAANVQIKLQYTIHNLLIIMFGVVRTVEYNQETNQSLLHFECIHIEQNMKNEVLKYVYDILPQEEKEVYDALSLTDADKQADESTTEDGEKIEKNLTETDVTIPSAVVSNSEEAAKIAAQNQQAEVADEGIKKLKKLISADALLPTDNASEEILNLFDDYE